MSTGDKKPQKPPVAPTQAGIHHKPLRTTVTVVAAAFIAAHLKWPALPIDSIVLGLLAVGLLPWLQPIFKSIELPGGFKAELADREQDTADAPPATDAPSIATPAAGNAPFSAEAAAAYSSPPDAADARRKVLATLWRYQQEYFPCEPAKRWTFAVRPTAPDFPYYLRGVAQLVSEGLVTLAPENHNCMLTNEGLIYCEEHPEEANSPDVYRF